MDGAHYRLGINHGYIRAGILMEKQYRAEVHIVHTVCLSNENVLICIVLNIIQIAIQSLQISSSRLAIIRI